ncbi:hypothetical protein [Ideonella sp.]|uniref:hypothetical protein n=1 Tax=Ideonella sp. TaxID=1929293 RepID=UPI003BB5D629
MKPILRTPSALRTAALVLSIAGLAALSACSTPLDRDTRMVPGSTSVAEVLAAHGEPSRRWPDADGGQTLEYSTQPFGRTCLMVKIDSNGRLRSIINTLSETERNRVVAGMTEEQVSRWLGKERSRVLFDLSGEDVWDWTVASDSPNHGQRFNVHFKQGVVVRTSHSMVYLDDNRLVR